MGPTASVDANASRRHYRVLPWLCLAQTLSNPPISTFSTLPSPPLLQWGASVDVLYDTVVIGCPGQPDASKSSFPTGAAFVYDRHNDEEHYVFRQVCKRA